MPLYEYQCGKCKKHFEELAGQDEVVPCPTCGSTETSRLMSACKHQGCRAATGSYSPASMGCGGGCGGCAGGNCGSCGR